MELIVKNIKYVLKKTNY